MTRSQGQPAFKQKAKPWTTIGWQGITLPVHAEWHLARVQGNRDRGYLRVDDDERVRIELRWEKPARRPEKFGRIADRMLAQMEKMSRRKKANFTVRRDVRITMPPGNEMECFETRGDVASCGCLTRCAACGRVLLGRVLGLPREDLKTMASRVLGGIADHPGPDGLDRWDVYDLKFVLPPTYMLQQTKMRTGAIELLFSDGTCEVDVRRLSLASIMLKEHTLTNFVVNYCYKELKPFEYRSADLDVNGHPGMGVTGPQTIRSRLLSHALRRRHVHLLAWQCGDRIYIFRMMTPEAEDPRFLDLAQRVECHAE